MTDRTIGTADDAARRDPDGPMDRREGRLVGDAGAPDGGGAADSDLRRDSDPRRDAGPGTGGAGAGPGPDHGGGRLDDGAGRADAGGTRSGPDGGDVALIDPERARGYQDRWQGLKGDFVDEPRRAVRDANALVGEVLDDVEATFRRQRERLERDLDDQDASTEDLRLALNRYRSFFDRLLTL